MCVYVIRNTDDTHKNNKCSTTGAALDEGATPLLPRVLLSILPLLFRIFLLCQHLLLRSLGCSNKQKHNYKCTTTIDSFIRGTCQSSLQSKYLALRMRGSTALQTIFQKERKCDQPLYMSRAKAFTETSSNLQLTCCSRVATTFRLQKSAKAVPVLEAITANIYIHLKPPSITGNCPGV